MYTVYTVDGLKTPPGNPWTGSDHATFVLLCMVFFTFLFKIINYIN